MRFGITKPAPAPSSAEVLREEKDLAPVATLGREEFDQIAEKIGYTFADPSLLERALTHRSVQVKGGDKNNYEQLEFLGDAVLDLAIAQMLLDAYPDAREGDLSKMRAALVNSASLAAVAKRINLGPFIRLSRGELVNGGAERPSILADVFEALIGALYKVAGFTIALECITRLFGELVKTVEPRDPKTELQEMLHVLGSTGPEYLLECVEGPEHAPVFVSIVKVDGQIVGRGRGATKKASQQSAASQALDKLKPGDEIDNEFLKGAVSEPAVQETKL